jgi:hypothetical protein
MNKLKSGTFGLLLLAATPVIAGASVDSQPEVKDYKGIPYVSGGFGINERQQLQTMANGDNLMLSFALQNRSYLGGANVVIKDSKGNIVLETVADGPLFYAKLPPGKYTIDATATGKTLEQVTDVPARGQKHIYFAWNETEKQASSAF